VIGGLLIIGGFYDFHQVFSRTRFATSTTPHRHCFNQIMERWFAEDKHSFIDADQITSSVVDASSGGDDGSGAQDLALTRSASNSVAEWIGLLHDLPRSVVEAEDITTSFAQNCFMVFDNYGADEVATCNVDWGGLDRC
jgi:hypothetical protein